MNAIVGSPGVRDTEPTGLQVGETQTDLLRVAQGDVIVVVEDNAEISRARGGDITKNSSKF